MRNVGDPMSISDIPGMAPRGIGGFSGFVSCLVFYLFLSFNQQHWETSCIYLRNCDCSPGQSSMVPNITADVMVPRLLIAALCGEDGGCLNKIREVGVRLVCRVAYPVNNEVYD